MSEDDVFGFVFIQLMMHSYFNAFNGEGYPSILPLENALAESGMLTFIDKSPSIPFSICFQMRDIMLPRELERGPGDLDLFDLAGTGSVRMINRYKDISN